MAPPNPGDISRTQTRVGRTDRVLDRRSGVLPARRDTDAGQRRVFADMRSARRGDVGGAEELRRALGLVEAAARGFQEYAQQRHAAKERGASGQAEMDALRGVQDPTLARQSLAYRIAHERGRAQRDFYERLNEREPSLRSLIESIPEHLSLEERQALVEEWMEANLADIAIDPESGTPRYEQPETLRWLAGQIGETRQRMTIEARSRVEARFNEEQLGNAQRTIQSALSSGAPLNWQDVFDALPDAIPPEQVRALAVNTVRSVMLSLRQQGRDEEAVRIGLQFVGMVEAAAQQGIETSDPPPPQSAERSAGGAQSASPPARASTPPAPSRGSQRASGGPSRASRRPSPEQTVYFVLNTLEGGDVVVDHGDGGGTTKFGITQNNHPDVDVQTLSYEQAARIALSRYWQRAYEGADPAVQAIAFDAGFVHSKEFAAGLARRYANDPAGALAAYRRRLNAVASSPSHQRFRRGWNNRLDRLGRWLGVTGVPGSGGAKGGGDGGLGAETPVDPVVPAADFRLAEVPQGPIRQLLRDGTAAAGPSPLTGRYQLSAQERAQFLEFFERFAEEADREWEREFREGQDRKASEFILRIYGQGSDLTAQEITDAMERGEIRAEHGVSLFNNLRARADRISSYIDAQRSEQERREQRAREDEAERLMAHYTGQMWRRRMTPAQVRERIMRDAPNIRDVRVRNTVVNSVFAAADDFERGALNTPVIRYVSTALSDLEAEIQSRVGNRRNSSDIMAEMRNVIDREQRRIADVARNGGDVNAALRQSSERIWSHYSRAVPPAAPGNAATPPARSNVYEQPR